MGASRKLQGEIDRVLKKVQEGVDFFDRNKVYDADNVNQKEKFEADLKNEIKKMQRYRDQINTWIQSSEIKDKKVGELESQIDSFEAEIEGLSVKKGKTMPPRLTHLDTSITRHKAHIMKLELILRLLDNDELSPELVNDVKGFLDNYVERNQEDFDEFSDIDELYNTLPLDKVESLEDLVVIGPPGLVKAAMGNNGTDLVDSSSPGEAAGIAGRVFSPSVVPGMQWRPGSSFQNQKEPGQFRGRTEIAPDQREKFLQRFQQVQQQGHSTLLGMPPPAGGNHMQFSAQQQNLLLQQFDSQSSSISPQAGIGLEVQAPDLSAVNSASLQQQPNSIHQQSSQQVLISNGPKDVDVGHSKNEEEQQQSLPDDSTLESTPRNLVNEDDLKVSYAVDSPEFSELKELQGLHSKITQGTQPTDCSLDSCLTSCEGSQKDQEIHNNGIGLRPPFQGQFHGRSEIAPDLREKFLQRFQQVQKQGHSNLLGMPPLAGGNHKQFSAQQQRPLLQQFNSRSLSVSPQVGIGLGVQAPDLSAVSPASLQQQPNSIHQQSSQVVLISNGPKDVDVGHSKNEEQLQQQILPDDSSLESTPKNLVNEDDLKASYAVYSPGFSELKELQGLHPQQTQGTQPTDCSMDSCLTSSEGSQKDQEIHNNGMGLRPPFQGRFHGRTGIAPDLREKFLQRFQQVQQQGYSNLLGMLPLAGENHKQFCAQQKNPLLQQFYSQSSSVSPQAGIGLGVQAPGLSAVDPAILQQQPNSIHQQSIQQIFISNGPKDVDVGHSKNEEQQQQNLPDDSTLESTQRIS